jgi:hypothetical protein
MASLPEGLAWLGLEHQVQKILTDQEIHGWRFDFQAAQALDSELRTELEATSDGVIESFPYVPGREFTPARNNSTKGYIKGCPFTKLVDTNPTSRQHIAWILQNHFGWVPDKFTDTNQAVVNEVTLKEIGSEEGLRFYRMFELTKHIGMLSEGKNAWLRLVTSEGRIHHHCEVNTNTHRCAHRGPNLAQTPSDLRFRRLFLADEGQAMVGADLSGIELRMFAHYLARYDDGAYADVLLNGDIHQVNADKIGIDRRTVKTITYAFLYGAGDQKIGLSYDPQLSPRKAAAKGKEIRAAYMEAVTGLDKLVEGVKRKVKTAGYINSIDGRRIYVDSEHKGLNYLLQSGAGVIAKRWMGNVPYLVEVKGLHCQQLAFVHDELQFTCVPADANELAHNLTWSAELVGLHYNLRIPIAAEAKIGANWAEVH